MIRSAALSRATTSLTTVGIGMALAGLLLSGCSAAAVPSAATSVTAGCTPAHQFSTVATGTLTVAADVSLPYVDVDDTTGAMSGVDGLVLTEIAKMECLQIKVANIHGSTAIGSVQQKQSDLAAGGWYWTAEHGKILNQTDPVYYDFTALTSVNGQYTTLSQLLGKTVGVTQGSLFVADLQKLLGSSNVKQYETLTEAMTDLRNKRIDAVIAGSGESGYQLKQLGDSSGLALQALASDPRLAATAAAGKVNFPHTLGNDAMTKALNADIATLRANGFVQKALDQYGLTAKANFQS